MIQDGISRSKFQEPEYTFTPKPLVCVKSFLTQLEKKEIPYRVFIAGFALVLAVTIFAFTLNSRVTYAVYVNGEAVASASSKEEVEAALVSAEQTLTELLGDGAALPKSVSYAMSMSAFSEEPVDAAILSTVEGVSERYVISIDGVPAGASDDENFIAAIADELTAMYTTENTVEIGFYNDVRVEKRFVSDDTPDMRDEILRQAVSSAIVERVDKIRFLTETPYDTIVIENPDMYDFERVVQTEGVPGTRYVVDRVTYRNNTEVWRESSAGAVVAFAVTEVVEVGTKPRPRDMSYGEYIWPVDEYILTSKFGSRSEPGASSNHQGVDLAGKRNQDIFAADGGLIIFAGVIKGYGNTIKIEHDNGDVTLYAHCEKLTAKTGERVARGDVIAKMGSTGNSSGVHLHFEIRPGGGNPVNPVKYLP